MSVKLKKDRYKSARGSYSRLLSLSCRKCGEKILTYQKDGPGNLRRIYFDRIFSPESLTNLQTKPLKSVPMLRCYKCNEYLGTPYIYEKETRKAFKVYQDSFVRR